MHHLLSRHANTPIRTVDYGDFIQTHLIRTQSTLKPSSGKTLVTYSLELGGSDTVSEPLLHEGATR